jgi:putative ABC transport system permease protein
MDEVFKITGFNMYRNYFKISFRNLTKHRLFALINISGLAVGICGAILITLHLTNEWSYDKHVYGAENLYYITNGTSGRYSPAPLPKAMVSDIPEVLASVRTYQLNDLAAIIDENIFSMSDGLAVDSSFFELFPNEFIQGDPKTALNQPGSIVLTESSAYQLFGDKNPMGELIEIAGETSVVKAIVKDVPSQSSVWYDYLVDMPRYPSIVEGNWTGNQFFSFVKTIPNADSKKIEFQITELIRTYAGPEVKAGGYDIEEYLKEKLFPYTLTPLLDIHLHKPNLSLGIGGSMQQFWILTVIGTLLLLIAVVNYVNLITAKAGLRLREIGLRKVFGSQRHYIVRQFFVETFVITSLSFLLSIVLVMAVLPFFSELVQRSLTWEMIFTSSNMLGMFLILVITACLSAVYPAFYLSSFNPVEALQGIFKGSSFSLRKGLVVFQFAVSIILIATTMIVYMQVSLMQNFDTGWDRESTFAIRNMDAVAEDYQLIKNELEALPFVDGTSLTSMMPSQNYIPNYTYRTMGEEPRPFSPDNIFADEQYLDLLEVNLVSGRYFQRTRLADTMSVVINQEFADALGWEDPVGRMLTRGRGYDFRIIGVIENFYPTHVKRKLRPLIIRYADEVNEQLSISDKLLVKFKETKADYVKQVASIYEQSSEGYPFEGVFLDDSFQRMYESDQRFGKMFTTFSLLAIFIASLGLISLAAYSLERRNKEIAIRKVVGASGGQLTQLLMREYVVLTTIASIISVPAVYYYAEHWLSGFANRVVLSWVHFAIPIGMVLALTVVLIIGQTLRAVMDNPSAALKQE